MDGRFAFHIYLYDFPTLERAYRPQSAIQLNDNRPVAPPTAAGASEGLLFFFGTCRGLEHPSVNPLALPFALFKSGIASSLLLSSNASQLLPLLAKPPFRFTWPPLVVFAPWRPPFVVVVRVVVQLAIKTDSVCSCREEALLTKRGMNGKEFQNHYHNKRSTKWHKVRPERDDRLAGKQINYHDSQLLKNLSFSI